MPGVPANRREKLTNCREVTCDEPLVTRTSWAGRVQIFSAASCYRTQDTLPAAMSQSAPRHHSQASFL